MPLWPFVAVGLAALGLGYVVGYAVAEEIEWQRARAYLAWMWRARGGEQ
mgnify:CR=1 FL=1